MVLNDEMTLFFGFLGKLINRVGASGGGKLTNRVAAVHRLSACVQVCFPRSLASAIRRRMTARSWLFTAKQRTTLSTCLGCG